MIKWPRALEGNPNIGNLDILFNADLRPLYAGSSLRVAHISVTPAFESALVFLNGIRQLDRGLEHIADKLSAEKKGIDALNAKLELTPAPRVSRLLMMSEGGSERFYRQCERLLMEHSGRLLGIRVDVVSTELIEKLYGVDALARVIMISHRDAVSRALLSLIE